MHHKRRSRRSDKNYDMSWSATNRTRKLPHDNEICNGKVKAKKPTPKKDKCPVNRTHEWYKELIVNHDYFMRWLGDDRFEKVEFTEKYHEWTCIHCWTVKKHPVRERALWKSWRSKRYGYYLPKRQVKF